MSSESLILSKWFEYGPTSRHTLSGGLLLTMFGHMHVSFLPKEHDVTRALDGDMGSDDVLTWASGHDVIVKGI